MKSGIIFFEDGDVQQFGRITSAAKLVESIQRVISDLVEQERTQLLASITDDELKRIVELKNKPEATE